MLVRLRLANSHKRRWIPDAWLCAAARLPWLIGAGAVVPDRWSTYQMTRNGRSKSIDKVNLVGRLLAAKAVVFNKALDATIPNDVDGRRGSFIERVADGYEDDWLSVPRET